MVAVQHRSSTPPLHAWTLGRLAVSDVVDVALEVALEELPDVAPAGWRGDANG